jgi:hypothetical protein
MIRRHALPGLVDTALLAKRFVGNSRKKTDALKTTVFTGYEGRTMG